MKILAIDPGNIDSGWCIIDTANRAPMIFGKTDNELLLTELGEHYYFFNQAVIEMVASYGMPVGAEVFETCVWIGRYQQLLAGQDKPVTLTYRRDVKLHHCGTSRAKDGNITQALVDRFTHGQANHGKGTKHNPGFFYGFHADIWAAYALAVQHADTAPDTDPSPELFSVEAPVVQVSTPKLCGYSAPSEGGK